MSKVIHEKYSNIINLLIQAALRVQKLVEEGRLKDCILLLGDCQESAITLGSHIEKIHGMDTKTVQALEQYCENLYRVSVDIETGQDTGAVKDLLASVEYVAETFQCELAKRKEIVFMPYKAAMWDSLESIWMAADADPDCDAYVVPMAYFERNPDNSLGEYHYEGDMFPPEVPIIHYEEFDLEERKPDVIYIHNPYDWANNATSVDPQYYSDKLKQHTECLVYVPYYSTTGGMAEAQEKCLAYYNADYIVIQSEKYRKFFDPALPDEKFLAYGSPKFDRVIRICKNPPEPPAEWKKKMDGKKVYFYNTTLGAMLGDTKKYFQKMRYVFDCFKGRENVCLLWRPHPLFESTIDSMRPTYRPIYNELKKEFLEADLGIYDDTPDITNTIALCDAYFGDGGSSVISLFGVAGKPIFIIGSGILHRPEEDDWKPGVVRGFSQYWGNEYRVAQGNKLYRSINNDYRYRYLCDLHSYAGGGYYHYAPVPYKDRYYICPANAQDILVLKDGKIIQRIELVKEIEQMGAFYGMTIMDEYLYLLPNKYPAIVRMNCETGEIQYIRGYNDIFVKWVAELGEWRFGPAMAYLGDKYLRLFSPTSDEVLYIENQTGKTWVTSLGVSHTCGCKGGFYDEKDKKWWLLPYSGKTITKWDEQTGEIWEYNEMPEDFVCINFPHEYLCEDRPFASLFVYEGVMYLTPEWGNQFLKIDMQTGKFEKWKPFFPTPDGPKSDYYSRWSRSGYFDVLPEDVGKGIGQYFSSYDCKLYDLDFRTETYTEIPVEYDVEELRANTGGFSIDSDWERYCCWESVFNTLDDFLDDHISGNQFSKEAQLQSYAEINASTDGLCGQRVHERVKKDFER